MTESRSSVERPWWVQIGLWGIHDRTTAWVFVWISIFLVVAPGLFASFFGSTRFFFCGIFLLAALWYWLCIRWVDQHGSWS